MKGLYLTIWVLFCFPPICSAQVDDSRAKVIAETETRLKAGYSQSKLLRARRREDLEDELFGFQVKLSGTIEKAAYFFEVSGNGYFVVSPNEAVYVDSADGKSVKLMAVSVKTGEAYPLFGFENSVLAFNKLAKDSKIKITMNRDAEAYARFCYLVTADPTADRLILGRRQLKHRVEDYFFSNYTREKAGGLFQKWWANFPSNESKLQVGSSSSEQTMGYESTLTALSGNRKTPMLDLWTFQVSSDGFCRLKSIRTLYPAAVNHRSP